MLSVSSDVYGYGEVIAVRLSGYNSLLTGATVEVVTGATSFKTGEATDHRSDADLTPYWQASPSSSS